MTAAMKVTTIMQLVLHYNFMTSDEQEMSEHVVNNTPVNEADCSNGISGLL